MSFVFRSGLVLDLRDLAHRAGGTHRDPGDDGLEDTQGDGTDPVAVSGMERICPVSEYRSSNAELNKYR